MNENLYEAYKQAKRMIEIFKDHADEDYVKSFKNAIKCFNEADKSYSERYDREMSVIKSFTPDQINHICYQIGDWYLMIKPLLEDKHNLGHMKEKLKTMICGD